MTDESQQEKPKSLDVIHKHWMRTVEDELVKQYLVHRPYAHELVREHGDRIVVGHKGLPRALDSSGGFYTVDNPDYPLAGFVRELASGVPDEYRLEAIRQRAERTALVSEEKASSGDYNPL